MYMSLAVRIMSSSYDILLAYFNYQNIRCLTHIIFLHRCDHSQTIREAMRLHCVSKEHSFILFLTICNVHIVTLLYYLLSQLQCSSMLFADYLVLCENARKQAEGQLELWRKVIENKGQQGARQNIYHCLPVMTVKLNLLKKR